MYITNQTEIARIAESVGVDRIFIDMEYIGKSDRQGGMDTVQCHHTIADILAIKKTVTHSEILVRCNPIHLATDEYSDSKDEIDAIVENGADIIMLPYFKTVEEVKKFVAFVAGRAKTLLLIETPEAVVCFDEIVEIEGIDEIFIGLNDLSLGYGLKFMFELLANGVVESLCEKCKKREIPCGFGGIAAPGKGLLDMEKIVAEHYRLGSTCAILSRSFCNTNLVTDLQEVRCVFEQGLKAIRLREQQCANGQVDFIENKQEVSRCVKKIVENIG